MIYSGKRLCRLCNLDLEKGDPGYEPRQEMREEIIECSFLLSEVIAWEQYICHESYDYKICKDKIKIFVEFKEASSIVLLESYINFTKMMQDYHRQNTIITLKEN